MNHTHLYHQTSAFHQQDGVVNLLTGAHLVAQALLARLQTPAAEGTVEEEANPEEYLLFWLGVVASAQKISGMVEAGYQPAADEHLVTAGEPFPAPRELLR